MRLALPVVGLVALFTFFAPVAAMAADDGAVRAATAYVICGDRQGSGAYLAGDGAYVLTAGHVAENVATLEKATTCTVGFGPTVGGQFSSVFTADVVFTIFDDRLDRDFALLKLRTDSSGRAKLPSEGFVVSETLAVGDAIAFYGYPSGRREIETSTGKVLGFRRGTIRTDGKIAEGYSGGPITDARGRLIGLASRLIIITDKNGQESIEDYEAVDMLGLENWMDTEQGGHDQFLRHAEPSFVHGTIPLIRSEEPPCSYLVRIRLAPAVYCLVPGIKRLTFPTLTTYRSWYADFRDVMTIRDADLAEYQLVANMTFKAGSLIKITTDPKVYYVADNMGTLRWLTSEAVAARLAGADWAKAVHDVPDTFFLNYRIGRPLE
jgi:hypothetical protein